MNSYSSVLSFKIESEEDFNEALPKLLQGVGRYVEPYKKFLELTGQEELVAYDLSGSCIAENIIGGKMCTIEGYDQQGEVSFINLIDSHRYPGLTTFTRYQYPSNLEEEVHKEIYKTSRKIIEKIGYEEAAFNIEYFYDSKENNLWLLEIETYTKTELTSDKDYFYIKATLDAYHNGARLHSDSWNEKIERNLL